MPTSVIAIGFLFVVFALSIYFGRKNYFKLLMIFLFALLVHELILRWLTNLLAFPPTTVTLFSLWKEVVLLILMAFALQRALNNRRSITETLDRRTLIMGALMLLWGALLTTLSPNRMAGIAAFRDYFEPMLVLVLAMVAQPDQPELRRSLKIWLIIGVGMALVGIWQAVSWGPEQYILFGFGQPTIEAGIPSVSISGQQLLRPASSVTGPNELGFHMVLLSIFTLKYMVFDTKRQRVVGAVLFILYSACLFYTRSRSDLIAYVLCVALIIIISYRRIGTIYRRNPIIWWSAVIIVILVIVGVLYATGMAGFIFSTVQKLRSEYHVIDISEAVVFLSNNPGGVGMGLAGPRIGAFFPETPAFHAEGSLFQIALDMGLVGLVLWLGFVLTILVRVYRPTIASTDPILKSVRATAVAGWIGGLFVFLILPLMQSMTLMSWMWFLLGLGIRYGDQRIRYQKSGMNQNSESLQSDLLE